MPVSRHSRKGQVGINVKRTIANRQESLPVSGRDRGARPVRGQGYAWVVPGARIELATPAFSGRRSTTELPRHLSRQNRACRFCVGFQTKVICMLPFVPTLVVQDSETACDTQRIPRLSRLANADAASNFKL